MQSESIFWAVAVPLLSLSLLILSLVLRLYRRDQFRISLKGFGVEFSVSSTSSDDKMTDNKESD